MKGSNATYQQISDLLFRYLDNSLTLEEREILSDWKNLSPENTEWFNHITSPEGLQQGLYDFYIISSEEEAERMHHLFVRAKANKENLGNSLKKTKTHHIHFLKTAWFRYAAAIILLFGISTYIWFNNTTSNPINPLNPINPSSDNYTRAILTLSDGTKIILDSSAKGNLAQQGDLKIINLAGKLDYKGVGSNVQYHTLTTPKGGQYQLVLPDGTKVWLNAASSIKFPTAFKKDRVVEIMGESYLEVSPDQTKPFLVKANGTTIQVLGTSFNVNAYPEAEAVKTTLLEGSIKIENKILKPGQAFIAGKIVVANTEQDLAWKQGLFDFNHLSLVEVMNQLARWYDLQIVYEGKLPSFDFYGKMGRDLSLNQVLKVLSSLGVDFKITEGRKLIVSAK